MLGGRAVQHRELQGYESDKFLSYFKPCIIPLEGGFASGFKKPEEEKFETRLYVCNGKRAIRVKEVPVSRASLNHHDVFILDTERKLYQFNGANSNIQERAKALEVIQHLKENYHGGVCDVAIVVDRKLQAESESEDAFWGHFGGFAPLENKVVCDDDVILETTPAKLYSIRNGQLNLEDTSLTKSILVNNKCFLLDCGAELFVWVGRATQVDERKAAKAAVEEFVVNQNRPKTTRITQLIQGYENRTFKSKFESWPVTTNATANGSEEGRGKVAALLKKKGVEVKGAKKSAPVKEEVPTLLGGGGKLEVWRVDGSDKTALLKEELGNFYSGDCYIALYTHQSSDKREESCLSYWIGKDSVPEDQQLAFQMANTIWNSLKGRPVLGRIYQGKEPPQFIALFQPMVVLKGGISCGYKTFIEEKGLTDETYSCNSIALIQVSGTSIYNNKALQVDTDAASLSSTNCFVLQSENIMFTWIGNESSYEQQKWAAKVAEFLKPGVAVRHSKEGTENAAFWSALGGKNSYTDKEPTQNVVREPHLYTYSLRNEKLEVAEVFNFSQDDLLTEDMMVLDTHAAVFVWIGQCVVTKEKQKAFQIGQKYVEHAVAFEGLSHDVPLYKVTEGNEPCFFRIHFSWDNTRPVTQGNSFQRKLSLLGIESEFVGSGDGGLTQRASALAALNSAFSSSSPMKQSSERPNSSDGGPTQRAAALAALSSALSSKDLSKSKSPQKQSRPGQGSQRAAAVAALSNVLTAESPIRASPSADVEKTESPKWEAVESTESSTDKDVPGDDVPYEEERSEPVVSEEQTANENGGETIYSYDRLISKSTNPARGIDNKRRETYLSEDEFQTVFGMTKEVFYLQPAWKQELQKKKFHLF